MSGLDPVGQSVFRIMIRLIYPVQYHQRSGTWFEVSHSQSTALVKTTTQSHDYSGELSMDLRKSTKFAGRQFQL